MIVGCEIAVLPLAFGAWEIAPAFTLPNLALLVHRIRIEDRLLASRRTLAPGEGRRDGAAVPNARQRHS